MCVRVRVCPCVLTVVLNESFQVNNSTISQPNRAYTPLPSAPPPINAASSLAQNAVRAVESRLGRPTTTVENETVTSALAEALSILTTGGEAARRAQLDANVLTALSTAPSAQLWASLMEAIEAVGRDVHNSDYPLRKR